MSTALVLAGQRAANDALAGVWGTRHRALIDVNGVPMLARVVRTLLASKSVRHVRISIDDPAALDAAPEIGRLVEQGHISLHASLDSPSRSVLDVLESQPVGETLLVATADHPLLTPEMVDHFASAGNGDAADVRVGMVPASLVRERFPGSTRTYLRLRGDAWSGANLFAFLTPEARRAAAFWRRVEQLRKQPWRLVRAFGVGTLLQFALRRLDLDAAFERVSRAVGARVRPVPMPFAEAAVDVDRPADLELVQQILSERARHPLPNG
jgi:GTP:adenosylcobinamide-phosphate guanylyltransferase